MVSLSNHVAIPLQQRRRFQRRDCRAALAMTSFAIFQLSGAGALPSHGVTVAPEVGAAGEGAPFPVDFDS